MFQTVCEIDIEKIKKNYDNITIDYNKEKEVLRLSFFKQNHWQDEIEIKLSEIYGR